jgi:hypothetical protein
MMMMMGGKPINCGGWSQQEQGQDFLLIALQWVQTNIEGI